MRRALLTLMALSLLASSSPVVQQPTATALPSDQSAYLVEVFPGDLSGPYR